MSIAKLRLDEGTTLEFGVSITGAESRPRAQFVIEGKNYSIAFPCRPVGDGIEVEIGELENIFESGEYPVRLEIMIEDKVYIPFQDTISLEPNVHITTKPKESRRLKESVKVEQVVVKAAQPRARTMKEHLSEGEKLKHRKLARLIAESVEYNYVEKQTNRQIIEESLYALSQNRSLPEAKVRLVMEMVDAAKKAGMEFSQQYVPKLNG
jgi:hypothetical protein